MSALGTFSGVVFAVTVVTQFLKGQVDQVLQLPTRVLTLLVSWAVLVGHRYFLNGSITLDGLFLDSLNAFLVALTAMGVYSVVKDNLCWK